MDIHVVGTVQDGGVPHLGCSCDVCDQARQDPSLQKYPSSICLTGEAESYLFDASPDIRLQIRGDDLDGVFLSHEHLGHLPGLLYFGTESLATTELPVYCTPALAAFIRRNEPFAQLVEQEHITLYPLDPGETMSAGGAAVTPHAVPHRTVHAETVAYRISGERSLLYLTDLDAWTDETVALVAEADVALVDGCFWDPAELDRYDDVPHPAITDSMARLDPEATEIHFIHLNHTNPALRPASAERARLTDRGFHVADRGDVIPIG